MFIGHSDRWIGGLNRPEYGFAGSIGIYNIVVIHKLLWPLYVIRTNGLVALTSLNRVFLALAEEFQKTWLSWL